MKFKQLRMKALVLAAVGTGLLSAGPLAFALPTFTINPIAIPGTSGLSTFTADQIAASAASELITVTSATTNTGVGYAYIGNFVDTLAAIPNISAGISGLGLGEPNGYALYLTYAVSVTSIAGRCSPLAAHTQ